MNFVSVLLVCLGFGLFLTFIWDAIIIDEEEWEDE